MLDLNKLAGMTKDQILEAIAQAKAEELHAAQSRISIKISQRGAISVYGMGRFPITLYREQWELLPYAQIVAFGKDHGDALVSAQEAWDALPESEKQRRSAARAPGKSGKPVTAREAYVESLEDSE